MIRPEFSGRNETRGFGCSKPGCPAHSRHGDTIIRTSKLGKPFEGYCPRHYIR